MVRVSWRLVVAAAAAVLVAPLAAGSSAEEEAAPPDDGRPDAVVATVDTGINPYHQVFRDTSPRAYEHPSTYLPGFPADAEALELTFTASTWAAAVKADCARVWKRVQPGKLYWFPGTRIVGGISFLPSAAGNCDTGAPTSTHILDTNGHGTMVASRAVSSEYGACRTCLVVAVQYPGTVSLVDPASSTPPTLAAITWAAANASWIDVQSNSWGPIVPGWSPVENGGLLTATPALVRAAQEVSRAHLAFWASGNGAAFRGGLVGHPTLLAPHLGPDAIVVGGHDSGQVTTWPGFWPHVVSDACASWAAARNHLTQSGDSVGSGTSAATPFVAGGSTRVLLEARRILGDSRTGVRGDVVAAGPAGLVPSGPLADGVLTVAEWKRLVFVTATPRPLKQYEDGPTCSATGLYGPTPVHWKDVPAGYPEYTTIGYGAVDGPAVAAAEAVLRGEKAAPARSETDRWFGVDATARGLLHTVYRGV